MASPVATGGRSRRPAQFPFQRIYSEHSDSSAAHDLPKSAGQRPNVSKGRSKLNHAGKLVGKDGSPNWRTAYRHCVCGPRMRRSSDRFFESSGLQNLSLERSSPTGSALVGNVLFDGRFTVIVDLAGRRLGL
jgi:hypothetical protein